MDKRADIWAFGCVLYEMLSGRQAFAGENVSDTIAAILRQEPDWQALPAGTPPRIRVLLERCLRKDSQQRMNDAADVRLEIDDAAADALTSLPVAARSTSQRPAALILTTACRCCDCRRVAWIFTRVSNKTPSPAYLSFSLPLPTQSVSDINADHRLAISPDGKKVVYEATVGDNASFTCAFLTNRKEN